MASKVLTYQPTAKEHIHVLLLHLCGDAPEDVDIMPGLSVWTDKSGAKDHHD